MANLTWLYAKAALTGFTRRGSELPTAEKSFRVDVDRAHLAAYGRVCGFGVGDGLPLTYPHVLAFPAQVELMTGRGFPFPLPGLVHVANRITRTRPLHAGEPLDVHVSLANLRPHERGQQFDVRSTASVDGEEVWVDVSTYLRRGDGSGEPAGKDRAEPPTPTGRWRVPGDTGRRYAQVSGDRNPIHLHALTARAFGFPRAIAHGMWSKARCVAAFEGRLPDACTVDVRFKAPIPLPGAVDFSATPTGAGWRFALWSDRPHLEGVLHA
ncbi:MaoC/PaaZ C-terminal domain-containing protein [Actinosynnema sp. NPDC047251]|uniref:MaoC domain protein dehydratase n=1 Tax=Saccharothrix espanaensis (strain ATCC 51144 / DSM 44229 / JCM 9112 / NBRC 15066 / NRRL 15764) TaxID=1179773 RepID=K0KFS2_SACES|nr:MaoC/PaaZ C-terminal domain-containing protein [Saccharothrix espanaensis]CCH35589.1 MaoC domain protein dehydratase [Saccharothrix espanaensis DSM 44229]